MYSGASFGHFGSCITTAILDRRNMKDMRRMYHHRNLDRRNMKDMRRRKFPVPRS